MSNSKKTRSDGGGTYAGDAEESAIPAKVSNFIDPNSWVKSAEDYARREPTKAVASAVGAGFLIHFLPVRAIIGALLAIAFALARPGLLFLGLLKAWEMCPCKKETKI